MTFINPDSEYGRGLINDRDKEMVLEKLESVETGAKVVPNNDVRVRSGDFQGDIAYGTNNLPITDEDGEQYLILDPDGSEVWVPLTFPMLNKSDKCRCLAELGYSVNQISKILDIRYQQVRMAVKGPGKVEAGARCTVCGRPLTASAEKGIGPVCAGKHKG
jgi:hypothetical protein